MSSNWSRLGFCRKHPGIISKGMVPLNVSGLRMKKKQSPSFSVSTALAGLVMAYQTSSQRSLPPSYSVASGNDELLFIRPSQLNVCMFVETITRRNAGQGLDRDTMQCSWSPRGESTIAFAFQIGRA